MVMRQQVWIDRHVQGVLVGRVLLYWSGILIYFGLSTGCFHWWQNPEWTLTEHLWGMFEQISPALPTMMLLLPLVIFDIVRLSNRFAGPVYRLRKHLTDLSQNSQTSPLHFRDDDYWQQLAEPINLLQQKLLVLEHQVQTLSFVHDSLSRGALPMDGTQNAHPVLNAKGDFVRDESGNEEIAKADVGADDSDEIAPEPKAASDVPPNLPIPPLPSETSEAFVTVAG